MAIVNGYATLDEVKAALRISDTVDDSLLEIAIESASRMIDGYAMRNFYQSGNGDATLPGRGSTIRADG
jgi:phage gp36-like protein